MKQAESRVELLVGELQLAKIWHNQRYVGVETGSHIEFSCDKTLTQLSAIISDIVSHMLVCFINICSSDHDVII